MFIEKLKNELNNRKTITENGAVMYSTSRSALLDLNYKVSSLRNKTDGEICDLFMKAFYEDRTLALKWLFFLRDVRGGLGERRTFRIIYRYLIQNYPKQMIDTVKLIPEYGRWDDVTDLLYYIYDTSLYNVDSVKMHIIKLIHQQLFEDIKNCKKGKPISLLAKWMPSETASNEKTKWLAKYLTENLLMTPRQYRKMLSELRNYINVVERNMSSNNWSLINYEEVPSRAALIYRNSFNKNDFDRYNEYLENVRNNKANINTDTLFMHDIVRAYKDKYDWYCYKKYVDNQLELAWSNLDREHSLDSTIVVCDGSASMYCETIGNGLQPSTVAHAITVYMSEMCCGEFKDKFITFSETPQLVDLHKDKTLNDKLRHLCRYDEVSNTNIEAVFDLILKTAIRNKMSNEDIPKNVLIVSDMEFDKAKDVYYSGWNNNIPFRDTDEDKALFDDICRDYEECGYKMPRLIFWNVNSRTCGIPVQENESGVCLVSGFSKYVLDMVVSNKLDPYEVLVEKLNSDRYKDIVFVD